MKFEFAPFRPNVLFLGLMLGAIAVYAIQQDMSNVVSLAVGALAVGFGKLSD